MYVVINRRAKNWNFTKNYYLNRNLKYLQIKNVTKQK